MFADPRRQLLLDLFARALESVDGRRRVRAALAPRTPAGSWWVVAIGKAASRMLLGAHDVLGQRIARALIVSRDGHFDPELTQVHSLQVLIGDHPVPGARSLAAGAAVLEFAASAPRGQQVLLLISGGASSLVEALPAKVSLADLQRLTQWSLASGIDIATTNALRRRISLLKDGRLATALGHCQTLALLLSDVAGNDAAVIGSGLACASPRQALPPLPEHIAAILRGAGDQSPGGVIDDRQIVGTLEDAVSAIQRGAAAMGLSSSRIAGRSDGDVASVARRFAHELVVGDSEILCWGGEPTLELPDMPGRGGRNQHLALVAARLLRGHEDLALLAAGTDGTDGNTQDAGAIVDGGTVERGRDAGFDLERCLAHADSGRFLEGAGDLLHTGYTGTNVGDLLIGLRQGISIDPDPTPPT